MINIPDIYFTEDYCKSSEKISGGTFQDFSYTCENGEIVYRFLIKQIDISYCDKTYYDISTPYGYGGPFFTWCKNGFEEQVVSEFDKRFQVYCDENNIVTEFIRFHPIIKNHEHFSNIYDICYLRNTVGTTFNQNENTYISEVSKKTRKKIEKGFHNGMSTEIDHECRSIDTFIRLYLLSMKNKKTANFYFFSKEYFANIVSQLKDNVFIINVNYEGKTIASALYFKYGKFLHAHLSATDKDYYFLSPAYLIRFAAIQWGDEHGYAYLHHGGGLSNEKGDSLYMFKKQFTKNTEFEYFIGKKIRNKKIYDEFLKKTNTLESSNYFPQYREGEK